jgi:magnesium chelatase family protein
MDRIDLVVNVPRPDPGGLLDSSGGGASSESLRREVVRARDYAAGRGRTSDGGLAGPELLSSCCMTAESVRFLEAAARTHHLSGRAITRTLRLSRTIADLDRSERVDTGHIAEALGFRTTGGQA